MKRLQELRRIAGMREEADQVRLAELRGRLTALARERAALLRGDPREPASSAAEFAALAAWDKGREARLQQIAAERARLAAALAAARDELRQSSGRRRAVDTLIARAEREARRRAARAAETEALPAAALPTDPAARSL